MGVCRWDNATDLYHGGSDATIRDLNHPHSYLFGHKLRYVVMGRLLKNRIERGIWEMDKLWSQCSKEEHSKVYQWARKRKRLKKKYEAGEIGRDKYLAKIAELEEELDEIERRYDGE